MQDSGSHLLNWLGRNLKSLGLNKAVLHDVGGVGVRHPPWDGGLGVVSTLRHQGRALRVLMSNEGTQNEKSEV